MRLEFNFGEVPIGVPSRTDREIVAPFRVLHHSMVGATTRAARDFALDVAVAPEGTTTRVMVAACAQLRGFGERHHAATLELRGPSQSMIVEISAFATGTAPRWGSLIEIGAPRDRIGTEGLHFFLNIANPQYIRNIARYAQLDHYVSIPAGTRGSEASPATRLKPGEVFLAASISNLERDAIIAAFDWQCTKLSWLGRFHTTLSDDSTLRDIRHALEHAIDLCSMRGCRHSPFTQPFPWSPGTVFQIGTTPVYGILISPNPVSNLLTRCLGGPNKDSIGLCVYAEAARLDDVTTFWGVKTNAVPAVTQLFAHCYTASMQNLTRLRALPCTVPSTALHEIRERVLTALNP